MTKLERKVVHEAIVWHAVKVIKYGCSKDRSKEDLALSRVVRALLKGQKVRI